VHRKTFTAKPPEPKFTVREKRLAEVDFEDADAGGDQQMGAVEVDDVISITPRARHNTEQVIQMTVTIQCPTDAVTWNASNIEKCWKDVQ